MFLTRIVITAFLFVFLQSVALAETTNPCADAIADYCDGLEGTPLHQCLAIKRNHMDSSCTERVIQHFQAHPEEPMPEAEELEPKKNGSSGGGYSLQWWQQTQKRRPTIQNLAPQRRQDSYYDANPVQQRGTPPNDSYDPYSNLRNQMQEYYSIPQD